MLDLGFYAGKRVLLTGHTGFKGSWMCRVLRLAGAEVTGFSLDPPTDPALFPLTGTAEGMRDLRGDVRDHEALLAAFRAAEPEIAIHMAAQPIVREGYRDPRGTYETNVMGTVNFMECVRHTPSLRSVLNVTTDKVYLNREWCWGYREDEPLDGFDPYSNSKSCSELVTHSYVNSFLSGPEAPAVSTARAGNVIGGGDFAPDRLIPDCVRAACAGRSIAVRNPHAVRPFQHVLEPVTAYLALAAAQYRDRALADWYNVGPGEADCVNAGTLAELFTRAWGEGCAWVSTAEPNAPHEASFLKLDCSKLRARLGWRSVWDIRRAVEETVRWSKIWRAGGDIPGEMDREIRAFLADGEKRENKESVL